MHFACAFFARAGVCVFRYAQSPCDRCLKRGLEAAACYLFSLHRFISLAQPGMRCGEHALCAPSVPISGLPILRLWPIYPSSLCLLCQPISARSHRLDASARRFVVYLPLCGLDGPSPHSYPTPYPSFHRSQARIIPSIDNTLFRSLYHFFTTNLIFRFLLSITSIILALILHPTDAMTRLIFLLQVDMPPLKKRRGLAGSIVNTAVSAALIGTAVGLTVYRL